MSSGVSGTPQHAFLSTHNALHLGGDDDDKILIQVSELGGDRTCTLSVFPFYDVEMVKRLVIKRLELPNSTNVSEIRIFYRGNELPNHRSLLACTTDRERARIRLQWAFRDSGSTTIGVRELGLRPPPQLEALINEINLAFQRGMNPRLTMDGTGGTYLMTNTKRQSVAMFKPSDEEAFAPNNPRGYEGKTGQKGFRSGVLSGEGAQREVAAFLLDAQYGGAAGVPQTTKVEACHPSFSYRQKNFTIDNLPSGGSNVLSTWKDGSLQEFVDAHECCGDFDSRVFSISDAHKIGIFDLRILNLDRNDGNLLVGPADHLRLSNGTSSSGNSTRTIDDGDLTPDGKVTKYRLIPIDHGLVLPDTMDLGDIDLVWYYWPQSKIGFTEAELRHIFSIDPDKDATRLARKLEIREECLRTMRVSTRVLQIGARMHLNLYQIATLVLRFDDFEQPSIMERAVKTSLMQAWTAFNASSLIHQNRLPGSVMIDLQIGEMQQQQTKEQNNGILKAHSSRRVEFAPSSSLPNNSLAPTLTTFDASIATSRSPSQSSSHQDQKGMPQQQLSKRSSSRFPSLFLSQDPKSSSINLPKLVTPSSDEEHSSWDSWSSSSSSSSDSSSSDMEHPITVSRISGVPLDVNAATSQAPVLFNRRKKRRKERNKEDSASGDCHSALVPEDQSRRPRCRSHSKLNSLTDAVVSTTNHRSHHHHHHHHHQSSTKSVSQCANVVKYSPLNQAVDVSTSKIRKHTTFNEDSDLLPQHHRTTTVRKRTTALSRRGTSARVTPPNVNSTWTLIDSNKKPILLDWENSLLEKTFFECFELLIRRHIIETHPDWESYPFNGENVLREMESAIAAAVAASHRHRRRSTTSRRFDPSASSSASGICQASCACSGAVSSSSSTSAATSKHDRRYSTSNQQFSDAKEHQQRISHKDTTDR